MSTSASGLILLHWGSCILDNRSGRPHNAVIIIARMWTTERLALTRLYVFSIDFAYSPVLHPPFSFPDPLIQYSEPFNEVLRNKKKSEQYQENNRLIR